MAELNIMMAKIEMNFQLIWACTCQLGSVEAYHYLDFCIASNAIVLLDKRVIDLSDTMEVKVPLQLWSLDDHTRHLHLSLVYPLWPLQTVA